MCNGLVIVVVIALVCVLFTFIILICSRTLPHNLKSAPADELNSIVANADKLNIDKLSEQRCSQEHIDGMYQTLSSVSKLLIAFEIPYFSLYGTLLGQVRNTTPGPMFWDDDIDLGVFAEHQVKLDKILYDTQILEQYNLKVKFDTVYQFIHVDWTEKVTKEYVVDIFLIGTLNNVQNKMFPLNATRLRHGEQKLWTPVSPSFTPLGENSHITTESTFWGLKMPLLPISCQTEFLTSAYGTQYMTHVSIWNHEASMGNKKLQLSHNPELNISSKPNYT
jgi:hypothetical protein